MPFDPEHSIADSDIAIVGMAAHLPGADTIENYWQNLREGIESIRHYSREELLAAGEAAHRLNRPEYVPAAAPLSGFEQFDAEFFGLSPKEAAIMDPQHRRFLEVAWEALENAGHMPEHTKGPIGVYGGCGMGSYFYFNICSNPDLVENVGMFLLRHTGNDKDFLTTRLSHILDLKGPSVNVQTACSTSLVATHFAAQALMIGECDIALAGGVTIELPQDRGYLYKEGEVLSPDGHCHAFDHRAQGTVFGSGAGVVVLRRLADAIADGDHIWAVIKGSAINNDGASKAGYLAPSVDGQAAAIAEAQTMAGTPADTIDYIECHGTGTYLGDPIEVAALTEAFHETTQDIRFCKLGSVKTNIGHLDTAAGVAGLIKTALSLHHKQIPASLGYEKPNPAIDFETSPFKVNDTLTDWVSHKGPRRAGVNSLGVGGTNAHVVLEEAPQRGPSEDSGWPFHILTVSGRTKGALDANAARLAAHLREHPEQSLADIAWTLQKGRRAFERRRVIVAETHEDAARQLEDNDPRRAFSHTVVGTDPDYVFMFPGGGAQYAGMARDLYETEPVFAEWMDRGLEILQPKLDYDIRALWLPEADALADADETLKKPSVQLPLIMITEYALAQLWMSWGVQPAALVGHSMGENTAACVAGVMSFEDCIGLVHLRGTLFDTVAAGGMLSVALPADRLAPLLGDDLDLGAVNAPNLSVATGPQAALDDLEARLKAKDIDCQRIAIDIAAHSRMLEPILQAFGDYLRSITLSAPQIPFTSNRSGAYITDAEAMNPDYWVDHLRGTVHFADCLTTLAEKPDRVFIEVGPGRALSSLAGQHGKVTPNQVISSLRHPKDDIADDAYFMAMLGRIWAVGGRFDWDQIWGDARRCRVPLPSYAFQHAPYFITPGKAVTEDENQWLTRSENPENWGYAPAWLPRYAACDVDATGDLSEAPLQTWLVFADDAGLVEGAAERLRTAGHKVVTVTPGDTFARVGEMRYVIAPERGRESYDALMSDLNTRDLVPDRIIHGWMVTCDESFRPGSSFFHRVQEQGFYSLFFLAQAIGGEDLATNIHICVLSSGAAQRKDEPLVHPEKATLAGPARVIPREFTNLTVATLDLDIAFAKGKGGVLNAGRLIANILEDALAEPNNTTALVRDGKRYELTYKPAALAALPDNSPLLRDGGVYLITGGFGGIGLTLAEALIQRNDAKIALVSRGELPDRATWDDVLANSAPSATVVRRIAAVRKLEALGGTVLPIAADVSNVEDIREARAQVEAVLGPINGVIHAAGHIDDGPIMAKDVTSIEDVFAPKIHGTQVLEEVFPDGTLDWLVLFSSSSTATAPIGQVDYVAANEYLNAYAKSRSGNKTRVLAINWGIWADVGMAADAMEARTGAVAPPPVTDTDVPMLDQASFDSAGNRLFTATYRTDERWFLDDHRTKAGDALVPGTGFLELATQALRAQGEKSAFEIKDLYFLRPLAVSDKEARDIRVTLPRSDVGYDFLVESGADGVFEQNAQASLSLMLSGMPDPLDIAAISARCDPPREAGELGWITSPQEAHLHFGPRWRVLQSTAYGSGEGLARLRLPAAAKDDGKAGYLLHPGLMDLATGWAMKLIEGYQGHHLWVPVSYRSVKVFGALPSEIVSWVRSSGANRSDGETANFDVTLAAPDGTVCVEIKGFTIRRMEELAGFGALAETAPKVIETGDEPVRPLSPAEERLRHNLSQGIRAEEGAALFLSALGTNQRQIILSSLDLEGLIAQAGQSKDEGADDGQKFARPQLDGDYAAPDNPIEERLAAFWQDLLGVDQIGVEDSFFDLGGHSLIAVRLFAQIRKAYQVDFPISVLFEAPTIRKCAALIAAHGVEDAGDAAQSGAGDTPKAPPRRFTYLVPMHLGEGGAKTPFFLVAGMFGNVLNLRHLAHLVGNDRPFYGLQARGLLGDETPHRTIEAAAKDYIAEMRQVQPNGPYMVGGFSGGGITAFEIAHQLKTAGEDVSEVVMLDTPLPVRPYIDRADNIRVKLMDLKSGGLPFVGAWLKRRVDKVLNKGSGQTAAIEEGQQFHNAAIQDAFLESVANYQVKPWDGPLALFRPPLVPKWVVGGRLVSEYRNYLYPDNDWTQFVPQIAVFEVPGDHDSMVLEPNVRVLAARLKRRLAQADAQAISPIHFKDAAE
jgi:acyl transferase domain-containing protein/thioesterase domain-containing protein/acyl carrier protein